MGARSASTTPATVDMVLVAIRAFLVVMLW